MIKKLLCLLLSVIILTLTGCWNNRDLTELAIVTGVAFDKSENGNIQITVQIVKAEALKTSESGGGKDSKAFVNLSSTGETMFDAIRNLLATLNNKAYFAHVQLIVISEELAKTNINDYFDFFERDTETRRRADLLIARGIKAKTVLDSESSLVKFPSAHDVESLKANKAYGKTPKITLLDYLKSSSKKGYGIVLPVIYNTKATEENIKHEDFKLEGGAIIKKGMLVGFIDPIQTRGFLFIDDEIESTIINIAGIKNPEKKLSIEVIRSSGKVKAKMNGSQPELSIEVEAQGNIGDQQSEDDISNPEIISKLEKEVQKEIQKEITDVIYISRNKYKTDIFGFINELNKNYYKDWKRLSNNWDNIYSKIPIKLKIKFKINRQGLINKTIEDKQKENT